MSARRTIFGVLALCALLLVTLAAGARPGGGQSFSGGSRSSASSSSSGGFRSSSSSSSAGGFRSSSSSSSSSTSSSGSAFGSSQSSTSSSSSSTSGAGFGVASSTSGSGSSSTYAPSDGSGDRSTSRGLLLFILLMVVIVVVAIAISRWTQRNRAAEWEATVQRENDEAVRATRHASVAAALAAIRSEDDAFSVVLFEDFLYALYAEAHTARAEGNLPRLAPYLGPSARAVLGMLPAHGIEGIVIGGMRIESIATEGSRVLLELVFTTNLAEKDAQGKPAAFYMEEKWHLSRSASARSRPPERARVIGCPSCGAPLPKTEMAICTYCGVAAQPGQHDWSVDGIEILAREARGPMLTETTEEVGTDWPTVVAPDVKPELDALRAKDPAFTWPAFVGRIEAVFAAFHASWSAQDLAGVRPYLSDNLYELQKYWVRAYQAQGLLNRTENPTVVTVHLARVRRDRFFDAVTVRVFATCLDYTTDAQGKVVAGSRTKPREYSEYWTFIRGTGKTGAPRSDGVCPSCGAPLTGINMSGRCTACNAKVTSGEFDWVLSRIEQDEVYEAAA